MIYKYKILIDDDLSKWRSLWGTELKMANSVYNIGKKIIKKMKDEEENKE